MEAAQHNREGLHRFQDYIFYNWFSLSSVGQNQTYVWPSFIQFRCGHREPLRIAVINSGRLTFKTERCAVMTSEPAFTECVTVLTRSEKPLLKEHLLRLDPESRRQRFNGAISQRFVEHYTTNYITDGTVVVGYIVAGKVRGVGELHPPDKHGSSAEIAFSVEKLVRSHGVGSILFERVIQEARIKGYESLRMTTDHNNEQMRALARKFGVRMEIRKGESTGILKLRPPSVARFESLNSQTVA